MKRNTSWDMLGGLKRLEHSYEEFDTRRATEEHLVFADGDVPKDRVRPTEEASRWFTERELCTLGLEALQLPHKRIYRYPVDTIHHTRPCHTLDTWNRSTYNLP